MILEDLKTYLEQEEFACTFLPASEDFPAERLLVFLGFDNKKREQMLEVMVMQQQISPEFAAPEAASLTQRIQFRVKFPFKAQSLALTQTGSLLLFLNQFIDLPGFELNELEEEISYRYVWLVSPEFINAPLLMNVVGALLLNITMFSDSIESVAEGQLTFNDLLTKIVKIAQDFSSSKPSL